ncbi:putative pre-mRNA-processing factor 19 [Histomonas meleagridis]|uniref:putative pre-mRNA-processing factor 19 n=1 Tax=Histomonas meleagridis TaxID=135588 RepID=UPI00355967D1|nr:putative pre-mRNA-processing factor 19 [Histomonas meleagridis]KAH0806879.1 putative pre-mRNA-processing factor 19 [Histomonas meleagridis]
MLLCRLTGQIVHSPVITPCRHIFEKSAIESYLQHNNTCPVCHQQLSSISLQELEVEPIHPPTGTLRATSFVELLAALQTEYEAALGEMHDLRLKLATAQRELSTALYEKEAAKRVIARLLAEKGNPPNQ